METTIQSTQDSESAELCQAAREVKFACHNIHSLMMGGRDAGMSQSRLDDWNAAILRVEQYQKGLIPEGGKRKAGPPTKVHLEILGDSYNLKANYLDMGRVEELMQRERDQPGALGESGKTLVLDRWLYKRYGYRPPMVSDHTLKGNMVEGQSMRIVDRVEPATHNRVPFTSEEPLSDGDLQGMPDDVLRSEEIVEDLKSSFDLKTFYLSKLTAMNHDQVQVYMRLLRANGYPEMKSARVIRTLIDHPEWMLNDMIKRIGWKYGVEPETYEAENHLSFQKALKKIYSSYQYSHIPERDRVKIFKVEWDQEFHDKLTDRLKLARLEYHRLETEGLVPEEFRVSNYDNLPSEFLNPD